MKTALSEFCSNAGGCGADPGGDDRIRVRSVVINTLENTRRPNTHVWLDDVNALIIPYLPG